MGGISASLLFYPSISAISHWFSQRRSFATGISFTAGGLGGISFPLIIIYLSPSIGFLWAIRVVGLISLVLSGASFFLLKKRLPPNKAKGGGAIDFKALREPKYAVVTLAVVLVEFAVFIPYTYISSYAITLGMDPHSAYLLNTLLNVGALPGRVLPGYFADRLGVFNTMVATSAACVILIIGMWLPIGKSNDAAITAFTILFGFWSGAALSVTPVSIGKVCRTEDYGKRSGTTFFVASWGALLGGPIAGATLQARGGDYLGLIILTGLLYAAAGAAFFWARQLVLEGRPQKYM